MNLPNSEILNLLERAVKYCPEIKFTKGKEESIINYRIVIRNHTFLIREITSWETLKDKIDIGMTQDRLQDCTLCYDYDSTVAKLYCSRCKKSTCDICHIKSMFKNKGKTICPFCRYGVEDPIMSYEKTVESYLYKLQTYMSKDTKKNIHDIIQKYIKTLQVDESDYYNIDFDIEF